MVSAAKDRYLSNHGCVSVHGQLTRTNERSSNFPTFYRIVLCRIFGQDIHFHLVANFSETSRHGYEGGETQEMDLSTRYIYMLIDQIFPDAVWIVVLADVPVDTPVALGMNRIA